MVHYANKQVKWTFLMTDAYVTNRSNYDCMPFRCVSDMAPVLYLLLYWLTQLSEPETLSGFLVIQYLWFSYDKSKYPLWKKVQDGYLRKASTYLFTLAGPCALEGFLESLN